MDKLAVVTIYNDGSMRIADGLTTGNLRRIGQQLIEAADLVKIPINPNANGNRPEAEAEAAEPPH